MQSKEATAREKDLFRSVKVSGFFTELLLHTSRSSREMVHWCHGGGKSFTERVCYDHRIIELLRLEKTLKTIESNLNPTILP